MRTEHNFGIIKPLSVWNTSIELPKDILKAVPGCGCVSCSVRGNNLNIRLEAPEFPFYKPEKVMNIRKTITLTFRDETTVDFEVKATIIKNV